MPVLSEAKNEATAELRIARHAVRVAPRFSTIKKSIARLLVHVKNLLCFPDDRYIMEE